MLPSGMAMSIGKTNVIDDISPAKQSLRHLSLETERNSTLLILLNSFLDLLYAPQAYVYHQIWILYLQKINSVHIQLTKHDREAILGGALAFGGDYRNDLTVDVTHLITMVPEGVCSSFYAIVPIAIEKIANPVFRKNMKLFRQKAILESRRYYRNGSMTASNFKRESTRYAHCFCRYAICTV
jgi:hypothetical protein